MPVIERLSGETDEAGFRAAARRLVLAGVPPDAVDWVVGGRAEGGLFDDEAALPAALTAPAAAGPLRVPAAFLDLCRAALLHRDPARFHLLYRLLWRLQREPGLRDDPLDADWAQAALWAQAVRRDQHKMKAFVRFRPLAQGDGSESLHVAWFEPQHHIVEAVSPFFMRRFTAMRWAILTPERSVRWDGTSLAFGPGAGRDQAPPADAGEALWLTYYAHIFNPARLNLRAMEKEMPRRYWADLPEARLISGLSAAATERSGRMIEREPQPPHRRLPKPVAAPAPHPPPAMTLAKTWATTLAGPPRSMAARETLWLAQRQAASTCQQCPLGALGTHTVWGEGTVGARLMLVGEQPGDQEDLRGRPFVGPAGQLLDRALAQLGWERRAVYVTNAVKHFKYELRGKRRLHKTPAQREAEACLHWLESEIELVQPEAIVALGATAARQLLGRPVAVMRERGQWVARGDGVLVLVTLHPSALLRTDAAEREAGYAAWLEDLRQAERFVRGAPP